MEHRPSFLNPQTVFAAIPLKKMDSAMLSMTIINNIGQTYTHEDRESIDMILDAMKVASILHQGQTRLNREKLPVTPYIEHPMRNTIRLQRLGVTCRYTLTATLLHDVVEDCLPRLLEIYCGIDPEKCTVEQGREYAYHWIAQSFDEIVAQIVRNVTNAILDAKISKEQKRYIYRDHVVKAINLDVETFLTKYADLKDNAGSLVYINNPKKAASVASMAAKYLLVVDPFKRAFEMYLSSGELESLDHQEIQDVLFALENQLRNLLGD